MFDWLLAQVLQHSFTFFLLYHWYQKQNNLPTYAEPPELRDYSEPRALGSRRPERNEGATTRAPRGSLNRVVPKATHLTTLDYSAGAIATHNNVRCIETGVTDFC